MNKILLSCIFFIFSVQCNKADNTSDKTTEKPPEKLPHYRFQGETPQILVESSGGLKLREKPDLKSNTLTVIPNGSFVSFLEDTDLEIEAEGKKGKFFKIQYKDHIGYSFSGLLNFWSYEGTISGYYEVTSNTGNRYTYKGITWQHTFLEEQKVKQNNPDSAPSRCNGVYINGFQCFYLVFTNEGNFVLNTKTLGGYEWQEWINDYEVQADASFTDAGCDITRKAAFNVSSKSYRNIVEKTDCSAYEQMKEDLEKKNR